MDHQLATFCPAAPAYQPVLHSLEFGRAVDAFYGGFHPRFDDPLVPALLSTKPMKRLAGIGFLGAIDYLRHGTGRAGHRRRHNRLEHSIGVAKLADLFAEESQLSPDRRRLMIAAALLHDVGHGPLSHTLEPVFSEKFGIDHHRMTRQIVTGENSLGADVPEILADAGLDLDEVIALIEGVHDGDVGYLFSGQINLDTLEGIGRCRAFVARRPAYEMPEHTVRRWARADRSTQSGFDAFWALKHDVYNLFIGASRGAALDAVAQMYMRINIASFDPTDFQITESTLRKRHPDLYHLFQVAGSNETSLKDHVPNDWLGKEVNLYQREFFIEEDANLNESASIDQRYRQTKSVTTHVLADILD